MADVVLNSVRKVYAPGQRPAVDGISLTIPDGSFVVLVGPSGCGKSTALRMIAGLEHITEGTVSIGGRVVNDLEPKDRDIAMVFQNYALYPHMTVRKNLGFALSLKGVPKDSVREKVENVARMLGITELLDRRPGELSGGQRQRVAVGRAIVREPKVFLFDEPLSNLDAKLRVTTRAELKSLHQRLKVTTVYVTHDQEEAMTLGDLVVVMNAGRIQQCAPPMEVYSRPANTFVAGFVGSPPMNLIPGTLTERAGTLGFTRTSGTEHDFIPLPPSSTAACKPFVNSSVVAGIRPQMFAAAPTAATTSGSPQTATGHLVSLSVELVEPLGEVTDLRGTSPPLGPISARVAGTLAARSGDLLRLMLDTGRMHLFTGDTSGARIC